MLMLAPYLQVGCDANHNIISVNPPGEGITFNCRPAPDGACGKLPIQHYFAHLSRRLQGPPSSIAVVGRWFGPKI